MLWNTQGFLLFKKNKKRKENKIMSNEKKKKELKDSRLVMRMTGKDDDKLHSLSNYLCKSRSDVMRDALDRMYEAEGGDDIRNRPPKECNTHVSLTNREREYLDELSKSSGDSESAIIRKALALYVKTRDI